MHIDIGIYRSTKDRWIRGVCGGIAEKVGIDSLWVRLGFVAAAIIVPGVSLLFMIILYVALGILLPARDATIM
jgi:phage shock protein C